MQPMLRDGRGEPALVPRVAAARDIRCVDWQTAWSIGPPQPVVRDRSQSMREFIYSI